MGRPSTRSSVIGSVAAGGLILLLDQWSKRAIRRNVQGRSIVCGPILRIRYVANANDVYARDGLRMALVLIWCAALVSSIVLYRMGGWIQGPVALLGLGLAFGGAAGNLLDILQAEQIPS